MPRRRSASAAAIELLEGRTLLSTIPQNYVETVFASGLDAPTSMQFAPDGRLFVTQQGGALRVIDNGTLVTTPVLTVSTTSFGERGLLGFTTDPNFATNHFIYVYYTATTPQLHNRLSRFTLNGNVAVAGSEAILLELDPVSASNHNGGALRFGSDGKLYVAVGENAVASNSQTLTNLHGKMLRLNADGTIPIDNPFYNTAEGKNRAIWALGLRNPYTFDVERGTGKMYINDVGQNTWEEINLGVKGANYGWPTTEGATSDPAFRGPVYTYPHFIGSTFNGAAITGGSFYDPISTTGAGAFPADTVGDYFFGDYVGDWIRKLDTSGPTPVVTEFATNVGSPVDLEVSTAGHLYYLERGNGGRVMKVTYSSQQTAPTITDQPDSRTASVGQSVTFSVTATGSAPLSYQWTRNNVAIAGATGSSYTIPSVAQSDFGVSFRVVVSNAVNSVTSQPAVLTATSNTPPVPTIQSPMAGTLFSGGQTITFSGSATDAQDGTLAASRFTWRVDLHHDDHTHPVVQPFNGVTSSQFTIPRTGHIETSIFYRIVLTVTDSQGTSTTVTRDIAPRLVNFTVRTSVPGLSLTLDGQPSTSPINRQGVVGITRALGAPLTQMVNGVTYQFTGWSDGGAATHDITTPSSTTTYTANYAITSGTPGLRATYYDNINFTGKPISRVDSALDFTWGRNAPATGIGGDTFSVRWTGRVTPQYSQTYTFYTVSDDRVRLWVDGKLLINNWTDHSARENSATIALVAGRAYDIRIDYAENAVDAVLRLLWSSASQAKQVIPSSRLMASVAGASLASVNVNNATPTGSTTSVLPGLAYDLTAGGSLGITGSADRFRFAYRSITGDFDVRTRIESFASGTDSHAKAGLMARTSLNGNSANVASLITPTLYASQYRPSAGAQTIHTIENAVAFPDAWLRLRRIGDTFETYRSADGVNWTLTRTMTVDLPDTLLVGLAASSKNGSASTTVKFRDIAI